MKKFLKMMITLSLILHPVMMTMTSHSIFAVEEINFFLNTPLAGDSSLTGEAVANHPISVLIDGEDFETTVEADGTFEFESVPELEEDQTIVLNQGQNEIRTTVLSLGSTVEKIELENSFIPDGLIDETEETENSSNDEMVSSELSEETSAPVEDVLESTDEYSESSLNEEENLDETLDSEENTDEETPEENDDALTDDEISDNEEEMSQFARSFQPANTNAATAPGLTSPNAVTREVSDYDSFWRAVGDATVERVVLTNNITTTNGSVRPVRSDSRRKIIDGNGYSLSMNSGAGLDTATRIDDIVLRNFSNIYTLNNSSLQGLVRMRTNAYRYHLENVTYNRDNLSNVGHLGAAWESEINFHGNISVNVLSQDVLAHYNAARIHDGANVNISANNTVFNQLDDAGAAGREGGLVIGNNATVNINAGTNIVYNAMGQGRNSPANLRVGNNSNVTLTSRNGNIHEVTAAHINVDIREGSVVELNAANRVISASNDSTSQQLNMNIRGELIISGGTGVYYNSQPLRFNVYETGTARFNTSEYAFFQNDFNINNHSEFTIHPGGRWYVNNTHSTNPAFRLRRPSIFRINTPQEVDLRSVGSPIISNPTDPNTSAHNFIINNVQMRSWHTNPNAPEPDAISTFFTSGSFNFRSAFTNVNTTPSSSTFPGEFNPMMKRWQFISGLDEPFVDSPIFDTDNTITGTGPANSTIEILDSNSNILETTQTDATGNFTFILGEPFEYNTTLRFRARRQGLTSTIVEEVVQGNRLELNSVADIIFETTEIRDEPNLLIPKESNHQVSVLDTRSTGNWQLTAMATGPLENEAGHTLDDSLYFLNPLDNSSQLIENQAVQVATKDQATPQSDSIDVMNWAVDEGFVMEMNPIYARTESAYRTTIEWTLTDAP